jgi:hypothetical protein
VLEELMIMKRSQSWSATAVLLATVAIGFTGAPMKGTRLASGPAQSTGRPVTGSRSLANGVYAVLREGRTRAEVQTDKGQEAVLVYDRKYSDADKDRQPIYVALDASSFVPLLLAGPPNTERDDRGWTLLNVTLAPQHVKTLENFTRSHLDGLVAVVIDGEIITMHKVRTVIEDGRARITRCSDDACRSLFLKLAR